MTSTQFSLPQNFRAAVIGGLGGIGSSVVALLTELGATIYATGSTQAEMESARFDKGDLVDASLLDVTDEDAVNTYARHCGPVDLLVNCAGILRRDAEYELATFRKVIDVNLTGSFSTCLAFRDGLAARKGSIVNIASMNAFAALPRIPAYCASKAGIVMLTKSLAVAWAPDSIRVNAVAPGYVETAINAEGRRDLDHYNRIAARTAVKRWAQPDEIAGAVVFLAMPAASYVTGTVYAVDGGFLAS